MQDCSQLHINLEAVKKNFKAIQNMLGSQKEIMPLLKANAYGLGYERMAFFFESLKVPLIGVSLIQEAFHLRSIGIRSPLFSLSCVKGAYKKAAQLGIQIGLSSFEELTMIEEEMSGHPSSLLIHLHLDTGMHRLGLKGNASQEAVERIHRHPSLQLEGVMSHFSASSNPSLRDFSLEQKKIFTDFCSTLSPQPKWIHIGSSNSIWNFEPSMCNLVRLGHLFYGVDPHIPFSLTPSLSLTTSVVSIHTVKKGEYIGYDGQHLEDQHERRIAVLSIGYHDGIHLQYSKKGYVWLNGCKAPYVGRICMDFMMVDISSIPHVEIGDRAEIFGPHLPPWEMAQWGSGSFRQLISCLGPRIKRVYHTTSKEHLHEQDKPALQPTL